MKRHKDPSTWQVIVLAAILLTALMVMYWIGERW